MELPSLKTVVFDAIVVVFVLNVHCLKNVPTYFCSFSVKYERILIKKIGRHVLEETLNKTMQKCSLYLKSMPALPWEI